MAEYNCSIARSIIQNKILDLEKKYMGNLESIILSDTFINDLKRIESETQTHYAFLTEVWGKKNKIKEASERLVRHHIYKNFSGSFYSSPISCDIAIELDDVVLNVDIKTIDKVGNGGELDTTQFEHNQTSFINKDVDATGPFPGFKVKSNLQSIDPRSGKPVLTYLIKIGYADDGKGCFSLIDDPDIPSLVLTCLPNGQLSNLFDNDLFLNFKDYIYFSDSGGGYYTPKKIDYYVTFKSLPETSQFTLIESKTFIPSTWQRVNTRTKIGYFDPAKNQLWSVVRRNKMVNLEAVKCGNTARFNDEWLTKRFDSADKPWKGERKYYKVY